MTKKILISILLLFSLGFSLFLFFGKTGKAPGFTGSSSEVSSLPVSSIVSSEVSISSEPSFVSSGSPVSSTILSDFDVNKKGLPIVLFHHFLYDEHKKGNKNVITQSESEFESQMKSLYDDGFRSISLADALAFLEGKIQLPPKSILLTFDDGYKSNVVIAAPILRKYGFQGVMFVMTAALDYPDEAYKPQATAYQYVNRTDLKNNGDVFTFVCHCDSQHVDYTKTDQSIITTDLLKCKEKLGGTDVMAYPIGKYNQSVISLMKQIGFRYCFTTERRYAKPGVNLLAIPRFTIAAETSPEQFMKVVKTGKKE